MVKEDQKKETPCHLFNVENYSYCRVLTQFDTRIIKTSAYSKGFQPFQ